MELSGCPECYAPAEVIDEGLVASTGGPVALIRVHCVNRHWFLMTRGHLPGAERPVPRRTAPRGRYPHRDPRGW